MKFLWSSICIQTRANKHDSKTPYTAVVANFYTNEVFKWRNFTYHTLISVCIHHILSVDTTFSRLSLQNTPWSWNSDKFVRVWNETNECLAAKLSNVERSLGLGKTTQKRTRKDAITIFIPLISITPLKDKRMMFLRVKSLKLPLFFVWTSNIFLE